MDVNEHETTSNFTLRKEKHFYCYSGYHSRNRVFNNENSSYL
jgi:hypothetical protein